MKVAICFKNVSISLHKHLVFLLSKIFNKAHTCTLIKVVKCLNFFIALRIFIDCALILYAIYAVIWQLAWPCDVIGQKHKTVLRMEWIVELVVICELLFSCLELLQKHMETIVLSEVLSDFIRYIELCWLFFCHRTALQIVLIHSRIHSINFL